MGTGDSALACTTSLLSISTSSPRGWRVLKSFTAVRVLQILLGTGSVAFLFFTARTWFGERAAWIAAALAALTGLFTFYEVLILQASVDAFLTSAALYLPDAGLTHRSA